MMELKGRLKLVEKKVPLCSIVSDIGTDHAYIPVSLIQKGLCKKALACDVRKGPVMTAKRNIARYKLEGSIEARLGSGLQPVAMDEVDVVIMAGMGGMLISEILDEGIEKAKKAKVLILQPMYAVEVVREWLYTKGFDIEDEELATEGNKIYIVISARYTGVQKIVSEINLHIGEKLIEKRDLLLVEYLKRKSFTIHKIIDEMANSKDDQLKTKYEWMKNEIDSMIKKYGGNYCG